MMTQTSTQPTQHETPNRARELEIGSAVGDYVISGKIGEGGMATVYAATHRAHGKKVAVKVISCKLSRQAEGVERFLQEGGSEAQIDHVNVVAVYGRGVLPDGRCYFIMEWLPGETLTHSIDNGGLSTVEKLDVLSQICEALGAAHAHGVVHRDLKPDNVVLVPVSGRPKLVKLLDFGLAKLTHQDPAQPRLTRIGLTMGTPEYISPEQARGRDVDHRTDIYALGVVAYELMVGQLPFRAESSAELLAMHLHEAPPAPSLVWAEMPVLLEDLILQMLAKRPSDRPSLDAIRDQLQLVHCRVLAASQRLIAPKPLRSLRCTLTFLGGERPVAARFRSRAAALVLFAVAAAAAVIMLRTLHEPEAMASAAETPAVVAVAPVPVAKARPAAVRSKRPHRGQRRSRHAVRARSGRSRRVAGAVLATPAQPNQPRDLMKSPPKNEVGASLHFGGNADAVLDVFRYLGDRSRRAVVVSPSAQGLRVAWTGRF